MVQESHCAILRAFNQHQGADVAEQKKKGGGGGSILKLFVLLVLFAVGGVLVWGFTLPKDYKFERSIVIDADIDDVHEWVVDLKKWDEWGPWRAEYPDMTYTYTETTTEVGDKMTFVTKDGTGSLQWTAINPDTGCEYKFQWDDWDPSSGAMRYEETSDGKVKVSWSMESKDVNFIGRYMMTIMGDGMNEMFDKGLAKLKTKVETNK